MKRLGKQVEPGYMSALLNSNPALYSAVMWHMASMLPRLREMKYQEVQAVAVQADKHNLEFPLHMAGPKDRFGVPLWSENKLSGAQVMALIVSSLWVLCGEDEQKAEPLVRAWPIKEAVMLCTKTT